MAKLNLSHRYGITPNEILNDPRLSFKAKGLYGYIQSKPDGWEFSADKILTQTKDGRDGINAGLNELEKYGLLTREKVHDKEGKWDMEYTLHERISEPSEHTPEPDSPSTEKPYTAKPSTEKPKTYSNKDISKKDISKKEVLVSPKGDTGKAGNEIEIVGNQNLEINEMQELIKREVTSLGLLYKKGRYERNRITNILTAKEFGETCERSNMTRAQFVAAIIKLSGKLSFWNGKIYNAETLYEHYPKVYNEAVRVKQQQATAQVENIT